MRALFPVFRKGKRSAPLMMVGFMLGVRVFSWSCSVCSGLCCVCLSLSFVCPVGFVCMLRSCLCCVVSCLFWLVCVVLFFPIPSVVSCRATVFVFSDPSVSVCFFRSRLSFFFCFRRSLFVFPGRLAPCGRAARAACRFDGPRLDGSRIGFARHHGTG
ncbi:hypothetical protein NRBB57_1189 [Bifidobacterium breve]|nr:hypothetical protein NRBB57_1189 [Bifidobacterium breve]